MCNTTFFILFKFLNFTFEQLSYALRRELYNVLNENEDFLWGYCYFYTQPTGTPLFMFGYTNALFVS